MHFIEKEVSMWSGAAGSYAGGRAARRQLRTLPFVLNRKAPKELFWEGNQGCFGGHRYEISLIDMYPASFRSRRNPWVRYVMKMLSVGYVHRNQKGWKWKVSCVERQDMQIKSLQAVLSSAFLSTPDKVSIAAWMLSHMLRKVPQYRLSVRLNCW